MAMFILGGIIFVILGWSVMTFQSGGRELIEAAQGQGHPFQASLFLFILGAILLGSILWLFLG